MRTRAKDAKHSAISNHWSGEKKIPSTVAERKELQRTGPQTGSVHGVWNTESHFTKDTEQTPFLSKPCHKNEWPSYQAIGRVKLARTLELNDAHGVALAKPLQVGQVRGRPHVDGQRRRHGAGVAQWTSDLQRKGKRGPCRPRPPARSSTNSSQISVYQLAVKKNLHIPPP